jgi:tRNA-specific 2-thiouridylase
MTAKSVILGMSGGVDSSVAALRLVEEGYRVHGVTLQVWEHEDETVAASTRWQERGCCKIGLARYVANRLGITHEVVDARHAFRKNVIHDFVSSYLSGTTPNPCVRCNERVKLLMLCDLAAERGVEYVATGHYARILTDRDSLTLGRAADRKKDQSYFLYRLQPAWLPRLLFPVGGLHKTDVWVQAERLGLPVDELKESQEICFVSHGDYRTFLETEAPEAKQSGAFTDRHGNILGQHGGIAFYTPGQRRGLGISADRRLYVQRVDPTSHTVVLTPEADLFQSDCVVGDLNLFDRGVIRRPLEAEVKVRYATPPSLAILKPSGDGMLSLRFRQPQRALSPGQSAVFYDGNRVLGGGIIQPFTTASSS